MSQVKFKYIPIEGLETDAISILDGEYEGLHFHYGTVSFNEKEDETIEMKFNYNILRKPDGFEDDDSFKNFAGDLLVRIMEEELPSLAQEGSYEDSADIPQQIEEQIKALKEEQDRLRNGEEYAESGTNDSTSPDPHG
jgi:hypothetical protein